MDGAGRGVDARCDADLLGHAPPFGGSAGSVFRAGRLRRFAAAAARLGASWASRCFLLLLAGLLCPSAAVADGTIFPPAISVGLVPPVGFSLAPGRPSFLRGDGASIVVAELPAGVEAQLALGVTPPGLLRAGMIETGRREVALAQARRGLLLTVKHLLVSGASSQTVSSWILLAAGEGVVAVVTATVPSEQPDPADVEAIERSLMTVRFRHLELAERRAALPFSFIEAEGLRFAGAFGGSAVILTPSGRIGSGAASSSLVISLSLRPVRSAEGESAAARSAMQTLAGLTELRIEREERISLRAGGGIVLEARARDQGSGRDVQVAQWLIWLPDGRTFRGVLQADRGEYGRVLPAAARVMDSLALR